MLSQILSFDIQAQDFAVIGFLVFLEGILSLDNALVLAILAKHLSPKLQKRALTYGLVGAIVFRFIAVASASILIKFQFLKFIGGGYLVFLAVKSLWTKGSDHKKEIKNLSFWKTVLIIELTDIAFAIDSILAAVALTQKFWLIYIGGFLGVVLMRFAATLFIKLLGQFPRLEKTAYWMVFLIGIKVILEGLEIPGIDFHSTKEPAFWVFWLILLGTLMGGFLKKPNRKKTLKSVEIEKV